MIEFKQITYLINYSINGHKNLIITMRTEGQHTWLAVYANQIFKKNIKNSAPPPRVLILLYANEIYV